MTRKDRKRYSREFKLEAVRMANESGKPVTEVARELDISVHHLYRWRDLAAKEGDKVFPGHGKTNSQDELTQLRRENARLREERDLLKKSLIFFAKDDGKSSDSSKTTGRNLE